MAVTMQANYLKEVLKKLGWRDGFQIPIANEENKALEEEVARLTLARLKAKTDFEYSSQKYEALERHLKFVTQESEHIQKLITTHKKQLDSENHYLQTTEAEKNRISNDIRQAMQKIKRLQEQNDHKKDEVKVGMGKIETIKRQTFWDEEALKAWEESLKKRDEDNNLLRKFSKEDEKKFVELETKRMNLQQEYLHRQSVITKMVNDVNNYESVLERTGKTIKVQIEERDSLISQWKDTVNILHQRDEEINKQQDKVLDGIQTIQNDKETLKNEESLMNIEKESNKELERENEELNAQYSRYQRDLGKAKQYIYLLNNEVHTMKQQVIKTSNNLERERCKRKNIRNEIETKEKEIVLIGEKNVKLKEKYESLKAANMNVADVCKHLEKLTDLEGRQHSVYLSDGGRTSKTLFRSQTKLSEQVNLTKTRETEIANLAVMIEMLQKLTGEVEIELGKCKEITYNMEFKIDQLEEKLALKERQQAGTDDEELYEKIRELEKTYSDLTETKALLHDQITKIEDEMRRLTTAIANDEKKLDILRNKLQNEKKNYDGGLKQMESTKNAAQEKQVEENILILKLKQFDLSTKKEEVEIYNLQKLKLNLEQAMRERELEIRAKKELLQVQMRNLEEDKGRLKGDLRNRQIKVDQQQSKYHLMSMCLGIDEDGQTLTVTHYKLKSAQDKYFLQQRGDILDDKVKTIEKEIVAMENTLKVVNMTNVAFQKSLSQVEDSDKEALIMESLQNKFVEATDYLRELKRNLALDKQELKDLNKEMIDLKETKDEFERNLINLEQEFNKVQKELEDKQEKVQRTTTLIQKLEKKLNPELATKYDRDLELQQLSEANKNGLQKLCHLASADNKFKPILTGLACEYGIKLPEIKLTALLSQSTISSGDIVSTLSSDLKSSSSRTRSKTNGSESIEPEESRGSCHCSSSSSSSRSGVTSIVLSFDSGNSV